MKKKSNPLKVKKKITRNILILVILIVVVSILLLIFSLSSGKKSSVSYKSHINKNYLTSKSSRHFSVESSDEKIYNLGDYNVNLNSRKLLILNISVQCTKDSFDTLTENDIIIQNAVLDAFSNYSSVYTATTNEGKEQMKEHILENINTAVHEPLITKIYFNKFIIQ